MFSSHFGPGLPLLVFATALTGCAGGPQPAEDSPSHMYAHFTQVGQIRDAVVTGDVDATRRPARWLATHEGDSFSEAAQRPLETMRTEARVIAAQTDLGDIAHSVARLGNACAECHRITDGGPRLRSGDSPPASNGPSAHMVRHAWAVDRLWEGLITPSDAAWSAGAGALLGPPLEVAEPGESGPTQATLLASRVHELGAVARDAPDPASRADAYAQLIETCSLCHDRLRMRAR